MPKYQFEIDDEVGRFTVPEWCYPYPEPYYPYCPPYYYKLETSTDKIEIDPEKMEKPKYNVTFNCPYCARTYSGEDLSEGLHLIKCECSREYVVNIKKTITADTFEMVVDD